MSIDTEAAYRAVQSRDARFDGTFYTGVRTTGIYCRPSCSARTPHRRNVDFYPSAAAAQRAGFRACKMCRPDATPGSPDWNARADLAGRAVRLIADGVIDREGVPGLARRLGYSERQLTRTLVSEMGAPPLALARAQRAHTARILLENTDLPASDVAFAAGFASIRQFNDTVREVYACTPTELRQRPAGRPSEPGTIELRLAYRQPMELARTLNFLAGAGDSGRRGVRRDELPAHPAAAARRRPGRVGSRRGIRAGDVAACRPPGPGRRGGPDPPAAGPGRRPAGGGRGAGRPAGAGRAGPAAAGAALARRGGRLRDGGPGGGRPADLGGRRAHPARPIDQPARAGRVRVRTGTAVPVGGGDRRAGSRPSCRCRRPGPGR